MELHFIPFANLQSLVAKLSGVAIMIASLYFYLNGSMVLADCCTMLVCAFMLFNALDVGGNFSALLRTVDLCVEKANKILALPTMDIEGRERPAEQGKGLSQKYGAALIIFKFTSECKSAKI